MVKFNIFSSFLKNMNEKPFKFIPITGFITSFLGDTICQVINIRKKNSILVKTTNENEKSQNKYNIKRSLIQGFGTVLISPINILQNIFIIPYLFPNNSSYRVLKSVIYTSFIIVPSQQYLMFNYFSLIHFRCINPQYVNLKHREAYFNYLKYIVPLVFFSFYYFSPVMRMLFAQLFSIVWSSYISLISNDIETTINYI